MSDKTSARVTQKKTCGHPDDCWKSDCKYEHSDKRALCTNKDCTNPDCNLIHPPPCRATNCVKKTECPYRHGGATPVKSAKKPCGHPDDCWKSECGYEHSDKRVLCTNKDCTNPDCKLIHPPECTAGLECDNIDTCIYRHKAVVTRPTTAPATDPALNVIVIGPAIIGDEALQSFKNELRTQFSPSIQPAHIVVGQRQVVLTMTTSEEAKQVALMLNGREIIQQRCTAFIGVATFAIMGGVTTSKNSQFFKTSTSILSKSADLQNKFTQWQLASNEAMYTHLSEIESVSNALSNEDPVVMYRPGYRRAAKASSEGKFYWIEGVCPNGDFEVTADPANSTGFSVKNKPPNMLGLWVEKERTVDFVLLEAVFSAKLPPRSTIKLTKDQLFVGRDAGKKGRFISSEPTAWTSHNNKITFSKSTWLWWVVCRRPEQFSNVREVFMQSKVSHDKTTKLTSVVVVDKQCGSELELTPGELRIRRHGSSTWDVVVKGSWTVPPPPDAKDDSIFDASWDSTPGQECQSHFAVKKCWGGRFWIDGSGNFADVLHVFHEKAASEQRSQVTLINGNNEETTLTTTGTKLGPSIGKQFEGARVAPGDWGIDSRPLSHWVSEEKGDVQQEELELRLPLQTKVEQLDEQKEEFERTVAGLSEQLKQATSAPQATALLQQLSRETARLQCRLPAYAHRKKLLEAVSTNQVTVLLGATGSGKSTQTLPFLVDGGVLGSKGVVCCTQPRKVAAMSLAKYVSAEWGSDIGVDVGYHVGGGGKQFQRGCRQVYKTDRTLLGELVRDRLLSNYDIVVVDEAHERSLDTDMLLAFLKVVCRERPLTSAKPFRLIIASATIEPTLFLKYFGITTRQDRAIVKIPGRTFPVEHVYNQRPKDLEKKVVDHSVRMAMDVHAQGAAGDILVFLPTPEDVKLACDKMESLLSRSSASSAAVLPLHGKLKPEEQQEVFDPPEPGTRKIIFSTNIAETSVTINGIVYVIDCGLAKNAVYDPVRNMNSLVVGSITRSSVTQRAGRAGRTRPGICYHLYDESDVEKMEETHIPEILRVELQSAVIRLLELGVEDPVHFDFLQSPGQEALQLAVHHLQTMDFVTAGTYKLTSAGKKVATLGVEPRIARFLLTAAELGVLDAAIDAAGILTAPGQLFWRHENPKQQQQAEANLAMLSSPNGDVVTYANIASEYRKQVKSRNDRAWCETHTVVPKTLKAAADFRRTVVSTITNSDLFANEKRQLEKGGTSPRPGGKWEDLLCRSFCAAYSDNICIPNGPRKAGFVLAKEIPGATQTVFGATWEDDVDAETASVSTQPQALDDLQCALCFDAIDDREFTTLPCNHTFHTACLESTRCVLCGDSVGRKTPPPIATQTNVFFHPSSVLSRGPPSPTPTQPAQWMTFQTLTVTKRPFARVCCCVDPAWPEARSVDILTVQRQLKTSIVTIPLSQYQEILGRFMGLKGCALQNMERLLDVLLAIENTPKPQIVIYATIDKVKEAKRFIERRLQNLVDERERYLREKEEKRQEYLIRLEERRRRQEAYLLEKQRRQEEYLERQRERERKHQEYLERQRAREQREREREERRREQANRSRGRPYCGTPGRTPPSSLLKANGDRGRPYSGTQGRRRPFY